MEQEVLVMLEKRAIQKVVPKEGQFLSNLFLVEKEDGGHLPVINLKSLNKFSLYCLKFFLEQGDFLSKIDLKKAYFSVPLNKNLYKFVRF